MNLSQLDVIRQGMSQMHGMLDKAVNQMTAEQLNHRSEQGVSAFFSLWHYVRTEDNIVNYCAQRRNTVWLAEAWNDRFNLHRTAQGTGMTKAQADAVTLNDADAWLAYQQQVWAASDQWLAALTPANLEDEILIKPAPPMTTWQALTGMLLYHGFRHVGELEHARGQQGLGGLTI